MSSPPPGLVTCDLGSNVLMGSAPPGLVTCIPLTAGVHMNPHRACSVPQRQRPSPQTPRHRVRNAFIIKTLSWYRYTQPVLVIARHILVKIRRELVVMFDMFLNLLLNLKTNYTSAVACGAARINPRLTAIITVI